MENWVGKYLAAQVPGRSPREWAAYRIVGDEGAALTLTVVAPATSRVVGRSFREAESAVLANLHHGDLVLWRERPDWLGAALLDGATAGGGEGDGDHGGEPTGPAEGHLRGATDSARQPVRAGAGDGPGGGGR